MRVLKRRHRLAASATARLTRGLETPAPGFAFKDEGFRHGHDGRCSCTFGGRHTARRSRRFHSRRRSHRIRRPRDHHFSRRSQESRATRRPARRRRCSFQAPSPNPLSRTPVDHRRRTIRWERWASSRKPFALLRRDPSRGSMPTAVVDPSALLGEGVSVGPYAVIEANVEIGVGAVIHSHVVIRARLQDRPQRGNPSASRSFIPRTEIGDRSIVHAGAVLGRDGFGYRLQGRRSQRRFRKSARFGIGNDVEIGANISIDCATFGWTTDRRRHQDRQPGEIAHNCSMSATTTSSSPTSGSADRRRPAITSFLPGRSESPTT